MLSVTIIYCHAECRYAECRGAITGAALLVHAVEATYPH
jgi:hypothetical protein